MKPRRSTMNLRCWSACFGVLFIGVPISLDAQSDPHADHAALVGAVSRELMERPTTLTNAPGRLHQAVSTDSLQAQAFYDQGFAYLASYVWVEAARSFHQALRDDPNLAMAHLGLAKAYAGVDAQDEMQSHLKKAQEVATAGHVTPKEAQWIALAVQQQAAIQAPIEERASLHQAYKQAIELLIAEDPKDPYAWILRGNAEEPGPWGRGQVGKVGLGDLFRGFSIRLPV